jgi:UDP-glucose 4-epimerase
LISNATILVVGGAGYIGSHVVHDLYKHGYSVIVYDNLSNGHREAVLAQPFICGDISDSEKLNNIFLNNNISSVMHFSAYAYVGESMENPEKYYKNNVSGTINLLSVMLKNNVKNFIFSSTCATYGNPIYVPIDEKHPQNPINPYGASKYMIERIIKDYSYAYGLKYMILRYFNAAGAHPDGIIGESHSVETHLIPLVLKTLTGEKENIRIFGADYDTFDGTCIRDYIHVCDLAIAHRLSLEIILSGGKSECINLGTGKGNSVKEVISACEKVTGLKAISIFSGKRIGDPPILIASNKYSKSILNFTPNYIDIHDIVKTAWYWEKNKKY